MPKFKNEQAEADYKIMPKRLVQVCDAFEAFALYYNVTPVVTRVREPCAGDSGVHEQGRGIDYRDQTVLPDGKMTCLFTGDQARQIAEMLNERFPRNDGKPVCLHHSFNGGPMHFHIQIPAVWLEKGEPRPRPSGGTEP